MTIEPVEIRPHLGGVQKRYSFPNGYGASVIRHPHSYGGDDGLWELAVLARNGRICYDTPITADVIGYQSDDEIEELLTQIAELPEAP